MRAIDAHVHLGGFRFGGVTDRLNVFESVKLYHNMIHEFVMKGMSGHRLDVKEFLKKNGLGGCVLVPLSKADETFIRDIKIKEVFRLRFFDYETNKCELGGFDGYKIHPVIEKMDITSERYSEFFSTSERKKVPLVVHIGFYPLREHKKFGAIEKLEILLDSHDLRIMVSHGGGEHWKELIRMSQNYDFLVDLSLCSQNATKELYNNIKSKRLVFGSDYPIGSPAFRKNMIMRNIDRRDSAKIMRRNALRFFG